MVYFVGAGPGDVDLITVKGKRALQQADVVIFDRLINPFLLTDIRNDAKLIYCGKQPCKHTLRQEDIQREILIHAKKGKTVVRLKGGDPAVFGRVGEEAELLAEHRVAYEIIPGITAGIAATMYAGVPITHRNHSKSFAVVTGHASKEDGTPKIDWPSISKGVETIVFYMGVKHLKMISTELVKHGKAKDTGALVVQWGTYSRQRTIEGTLATIANKVEQAKITNPAIIVVGDVVKLRNKLAWFDQKPLSGKSFLIPRKMETNEKTVSTLKENGADVFEHDLLINREEKQNIKNLLNLSSKRELVFLSEKSVYAFLLTVGTNGLDLRQIQSTFLAINEKVQRTLQSVGLQANLFVKRVGMSPVLVGGELEINYYQDQLNNKAEELVLTKQIVAQKDVESFTRLIEEQHVNTIFVSNPMDALTLIRFIELSGISMKDVLDKVKVICQGKETMHVLNKHNVPFEWAIEDLPDLVSTLGEVVLQKESS